MDKKLKNIFDDQIESPESSKKATILVEQQATIVQEMINSLISVNSKNNQSQSQNLLLTERLIYLILNEQDQTKYKFDIPKQLENLIIKLTEYENNCKFVKLSNIQRSIDLISMKEIKRIASIHRDKFKIYCLVALRQYYLQQNKNKEAKKTNVSILQNIQFMIEKQSTKQNNSIFNFLIQELIHSYKISAARLKKNKKYIECIETVNKVVKRIQSLNTEQKQIMQEELMLQYIELAELHQKLHYQITSKRYFEIAYNISVRTHHKLQKQLAIKLQK